MLDGDRLFRRLAPRRGQIDRVLAAVGGGGAALDEAGGLEPVQQARNVAFGHIEALGELLLTDSFRLGQRRHDVALGNRKPDFAQPLGDRELQPALQAKKAEPNADRAVLTLLFEHQSSFPAPLRALRGATL